MKEIMKKVLEGGITLLTIKKIISLFRFFISSLLLLVVAMGPAHAETIDHIQINQAGEEAEIQIHFVTRVQFLRQVMLKNGDVRLYFNLLEKDATNKNVVRQRRDSPPSKIVPPFTVTYPEIDSSMTISFGKELSSYHIRPGNDGRSISFFTPIIQSTSQLAANAVAPAVAATSAATPKVLAPAQTGAPAPAINRTGAEIELTELEAKQLMDNANTMKRSNLFQAQAAMLRKLVSLPPNKLSQTALLTLGQLEEQLGEFAKARTDYLSYITLYPNAKDVELARANLMRMVMATYVPEKSTPEKLVAEDKLITFGGFSQNFYRGLSRIDNTLPVVSSSNISDQSQLVSTLDLTSMKRSATAETRMVFRDTFSANFLRGAGSNNFLDAAYVEQGTNDQSYYYGLGRQTGSPGGLPSRFDGAWLGHNFNDAWRINGTLAQPTRVAGNTEEAKILAAINVTLTRQPGEWSGNTYLISQRVGKTMDKRAVGVEAHYYDGKRNHAVLMEYDTLFKAPNFGSFQGNWITADNDNYTLLLDHRRSPSLQASNALLRELPNQTLAGLGLSADTLHTNALLASPIINQLNVGLTHPYSSRLKFGGDIKVTNTTSYEAYDAVKAPLLPRTVFPRTGSSTFSAQLIGNNLLFDNDLGVASTSYTNASTYQAKLLSFSQVATFKKDWRLDISLQLYAQKNELDTDGDLTRITPTFKVNYQMRPAQNLEFGAGIEQSHITTPTIDSKIRRKFFNLGYRWDFK